MTNTQAVGTSELSIILLKVWMHCDPIVLREIYRVIALVWREGAVPSRWRDAVLKVLHSKKKERV